MALMIAALFWGSAYCNEVYIEQVGSGSTINITQEGSDNSVGTSITPAFVGGGTNTVNVDQIGSNNTLLMLVNGPGAAATVTTNGSGNTQEIACGSVISAGCSASTITQTITGDNNNIMQDLGAGANHTSNITVTGDTNNVTHTSTSAGASNVDITVSGNTNTIGVTQSGTVLQTVSVNSTGNNNNISIVQSD